jgi:hypothetical protein
MILIEKNVEAVLEELILKANLKYSNKKRGI